MKNKPPKNSEQTTETQRDIQDHCSSEVSIKANKAVLEGIAALQSNFVIFNLEIKMRLNPSPTMERSF